MRGECRASGDGSLYTVPSCELSDVKTKIMLIRSAAVRCRAVRPAASGHRRASGAAPRRTPVGGPSGRVRLSSRAVRSISRLSLSLFRLFRLTRVAARSRGRPGQHRTRVDHASGP